MTTVEPQGPLEPTRLRREPLVVCVILHWGSPEDTAACLASLHHGTYRNVLPLVLYYPPSGGGVPSCDDAGSGVALVELRENRGYAGNNNVGIRAALDAGAEWVFVLNADTELGPECLASLLAVGESDPTIGVVGPLVFHHAEPSIIQSAGGRLSTRWEESHVGRNEADRGQFTQPHTVQWISGCAILIRRQAIENVGPLDERLFMYWEETEWCLRAGAAGWRVVNVPSAKVWHKGVQRDYRPKPAVTYYSTRNRLLVLAKHHAPLRAWVTAILQIGRTLTSWTIRPKWRSKREHRDAMWLAVTDFLRRRSGPMPGASVQGSSGAAR